MCMKKRSNTLYDFLDYKKAQIIATSEYVENLKDSRYVPLNTKLIFLTNFGEVFGEVVNSDEVVKHFEANETNLTDENFDEINFSYLEYAADEVIQYQESIPGNENITVKQFTGTIHLKDVTIYPYLTKEPVKKGHLLLFTDQIVGISYGTLSNET